MELKSLVTINEFEMLSSIDPIPSNGLLVILLMSEWDTPVNRWLNRHVNIFADKIKDNLFMPIQNNELRKKLRDLLNTTENDEPIMILTPIHPSNWETQLSNQRGVQIRLGYVRDENELIKFLKKLTEIICSTSDNKLEDIAFSSKVHRIISFCKKIPVLGILGVALS